MIYPVDSVIHLSNNWGLVAGTVMNFTLARQNKDFMTEKTEHFKALAKSDHSSAIADHVKTTGHIKWDHFDVLASGKTDFHCKI